MQFTSWIHVLGCYFNYALTYCSSSETKPEATAASFVRAVPRNDRKFLIYMCNRTIFSSQSKKANKNQQIQNGKQHKDPSISKQNLKNDDLNLDIIILTSFVWSHSILVSSTWLNKMFRVKFKLIQTRHKIWLPGKSIRR